LVTLVSTSEFHEYLEEKARLKAQTELEENGEYVERSLILVTAVAPASGYDKVSRSAHSAVERDLTLKAAA
jgi:fumarate hydratase class II